VREGRFDRRMRLCLALARIIWIEPEKPDELMEDSAR